MKKPACIITGADINQQWMLLWWLKNYQRHNDTPVFIADFGMSPAAIDRIRAANVRTYSVDIADFKSAWFGKGRALAEVIDDFEIIAWCDIDCEIRGDLRPSFKYAMDGAGATIDKHYGEGRLGWGDGYIVFDTAASLLGEWIQCMEVTHHRMRGSQECLNLIRKCPCDDIHEMPIRYHRYRLMGDKAKDTVCMHWTGPTGKAVIRKLIRMSKCPVI